MIKITILLAGSLILMISCQHKKTNDAADIVNYEKAKESLEEREKKNPVLFLSVSSKDKHNLIGQLVIRGSISNNAKICTYRDVQLELSFFSKTGTLLEKDTETVYEELVPGKTADFKTKYFAPKGTDSVAIKVLGAKVR